ncbi:hypothetical protein [Halegenticoccus tardaugens]|uniref:hypothetical protein n=1 Tax=Halegenticoccus tardaugens TaxID=2071624 RepID=UPI00100BCDAE|nr:hypothetical protein [Halegenticoccus tardaugens]
MRQSGLNAEEVTAFLARNPRVATMIVLAVLLLATQGTVGAVESGGDLVVGTQSSHSASNGP